MLRSLTFVSVLLFAHAAAAEEPARTSTRATPAARGRAAQAAPAPKGGHVSDDVSVRAALLRDLRVVELPSGGAVAEPAVRAAASGMVEPPKQNGLGRIETPTTARGTQHAGGFRELAVAVNAQAVSRPTVGARVLRRMNVTGAVEALKPAVQACVADLDSGPAATPTFRVSVTETGAVETTAVADRAGLPDGALSCLASALDDAAFGAPGGAGATLTLALPIPARTAAGKASAATLAAR